MTARIISGSGHSAVTQGVTNPGAAPAQAVALTDGEGNLVVFGAGGTLPVAASGAVNSLTYPSTTHATDNAGDSVDTSGFTTLAVDANVTVFTGGTTPSVTFFVDRLGADGIWYPVWSSGALTTTGKKSASLGPGLTGGTVTAGVGTGVGAFPTSLTTQARFGWTLAGSPTSITFSASVVGRP